MAAMAGLIRHVCRSRAVFQRSRHSRLQTELQKVRPFHRSALFHCTARLADYDRESEKLIAVLAELTPESQCRLYSELENQLREYAMFGDSDLLSSVIAVTVANMTSERRSRLKTELQEGIQCSAQQADGIVESYVKMAAALPKKKVLTEWEKRFYATEAAMGKVPFDRVKTPWQLEMEKLEKEKAAYEAERSKPKSDLEVGFIEARKRQKNVPRLLRLPDEIDQKMFALRTQAEWGPKKKNYSFLFFLTSKEYMEAWESLEDMPKEEAMKEYIKLVDDYLAGKFQYTYSHLAVEERDNMFIITLNRPEKKNAINYQMYREWKEALHEAAKSDASVTVVTGAGDYYCSGNDLGNFQGVTPLTAHQKARQGSRILELFVYAFIRCRKPLIAVVNGPAVGVSVTTLGLCDAVYATEKATFHTPFTELGQSPEGCSTVTFPKIMGRAKANEMLLFNKKITAKEAHDLGLVTEVFPDDIFQKEVWDKLKKFAQLPAKNLEASKRAIRGEEATDLNEANWNECRTLRERWTSMECMHAVMRFFKEKSKSSEKEAPKSSAPQTSENIAPKSPENKA